MSKAAGPPDDVGEGAEGAPRRLGTTVVSLGVVSLFTDIASEMVYTQVPLFLTTVIGAPAMVVGLVEGIAESVASLMKVVSGHLSDRSGRRKPLVLLGYGFGAISKPLIALSHVWPTVLLWRFVDRLGKGMRSAPRDAMIAETTDPSIRGRAFGLHRAMDTTGAVLGPLLGLWFLKNISGDLRNLFLFAGIPGVLAVIALAAGVREPSGRRSTQTETKPGAGHLPLPKWRDLDPGYRRFLAAALLFSLGNSSDAFLVLRASRLGMGAAEILAVYAAFNVVEALLGYGAGRLSDRVGRRPLIVAGYLLFALVYFGFGIGGSKVMIWALFLLYGGYYTLTQGVQRAFAADMADPNQRATQIGAYHATVGVAALPASIVAGQLFQLHPAAPFFLGSALAVLSVPLLLSLPTARSAVARG